ncbi:squalene/phytoene synthase family protein [Roseomonas sp. PWR1]|uniref:Squalene/phytoene synthase family protein n=2 Tax=Roseomonas nitratireducens TaxID=2820810 RepID=A0ABS4ARB0_9PROT|nr:squalene/phytoene synthase family protein [Neoroseomonas nitratireducens]MBP0463107.1 squalene/phytoene synthase family protein [Neoroseomonas nitratireducens]
MHDPDRFLCSLFAPPERREALFALVALNHELARAREAASNPVAALIRLQWWREAIEDAAAGRPPRRHEVAAPLHAAIADGALDVAALLAMVEAREIEAEEEGIATEQDFVAWLRGTAGGWSAAAGLALGATVERAEVLRALGAAYGLAGALRSVAAHAGQGRCLLPRDRLAAAGLQAEALVAAPDSAGALVAALAGEGLEALRGARRDVPRAVIAAALPAVLARRDLARLAQGRPVAVPRGAAARLAVMIAGWRGRV